MTYSVKIASLEEFRNAREAWDGLVLKMELPTVFCTWEWIYTWWEHFGLSYDLLILFVCAEGELRGILPLAVHNEILGQGWLTGRTVTFCGSKELYPDHLDLITPREDADQCIAAVLDFFLSKYREWDVLRLEHVRENNYFSYKLRDNQTNLGVEIEQASVAPYICLSGSFDEYEKTLNYNLRKNIRKRKKKLSEKDDFKYTVCEEHSIHEAMKALFDLHARRAKRKEIVSTFADRKLFSFHSEFLNRIVGSSWGWLRTIRNDERVIAAAYCFAIGGRVFAYQKGIDPDWEQYGLGTLVNYETIKEAFSGGYKEFDFLRGNEEHKAQWTQKKRALLNINIYNTTFHASISKALLHAKTSTKAVVKKLMGRG